MSEQPNPAFAMILHAAKEQVLNPDKIDVNKLIKQTTGNYTVEGKEVKKSNDK